MPKRGKGRERKKRKKKDEGPSGKADGSKAYHGGPSIRRHGS